MISAVLFVSMPLSGASRAATDMEIARHIATQLAAEFDPDRVSVTVSEGSTYAEMDGSVMSGVKIHKMRLDAVLADDVPLSDDIESLSALITYSRGEIVLRESDINDYFAANEVSGFSGLAFDFTPEGFSASGVFSASLLVTVNVSLRATGVLALGRDGVYLDKVKIYAENIKTPDMLAEQVLERVNPLIKWSQIPFKVDFKDIVMDDEKATMTGYPEPIEGETYEWTKGS